MLYWTEYSILFLRRLPDHPKAAKSYLYHRAALNFEALADNTVDGKIWMYYGLHGSRSESPWQHLSRGTWPT